MNNVHILCGPIIGRVTHDTANIVLEIGGEIPSIIDLECVLVTTKDDKTITLTNKLSFEKNRPRGYSFTKLKPCTNYRFMIVDSRISEQERRTRTANIRTLAINPTRLRVVFTSNELKQSDNKEDGKSILDSSNDIDYVIHLGNQLNPLSALNKYLSDSNNMKTIVNMKTPEKEEKIKELIRTSYRTTWNGVQWRRILSSFSNLMIWGSHDSVFEDASQYRELQVNIISLAHDIYREYQRQLFAPLEATITKTNKPREFHYHRIASFGIFIFDFRGNRLKNYTCNTNDKLLGKTQYACLKKFLEDPELKNLVVCTEYPFVNKLPSGSIIDTIKSMFISPSNSQKVVISEFPCVDKDLYVLYKILEKWAENKKLLLVSGNNMLGGLSETYISNRTTGTIIKQLSVGFTEAPKESHNTTMVYKKWDIIHRPYNNQEKVNSVLIEISETSQVSEKFINIHKRFGDELSEINLPSHKSKVEEKGCVVTKLMKLYDDNIPTSSPGSISMDDEESPSSTLWFPVNALVKKKEEKKPINNKAIMMIPPNIIKTPSVKQDTDVKKLDKNTAFEKEYNEILDLLGYDSDASDTPEDKGKEETTKDENAGGTDKYLEKMKPKKDYKFVESDELNKEEVDVATEMVLEKVGKHGLTKMP
jgi:hypothetical protein